MQLITKGDENDGDDVTSTHELTNEELVKYTAAFNKLKGSIEFDGRWGTQDNRDDHDPYVLYKDVLTVEEIDLLNEYMPGNEYGIHTFYGATVITGSYEL